MTLDSPLELGTIPGEIDSVLSLTELFVNYFYLDIHWRTLNSEQSYWDIKLRVTEI